MAFLNSLSIQRINELFSDSIDQNFDFIIRDLFQQEIIKKPLLHDVLITRIRGSHSSLLRTTQADKQQKITRKNGTKIN